MILSFSPSPKSYFSTRCPSGPSASASTSRAPASIMSRAFPLVSSAEKPSSLANMPWFHVEAMAARPLPSSGLDKGGRDHALLHQLPIPRTPATAVASLMNFLRDVAMHLRSQNFA